MSRGKWVVNGRIVGSLLGVFALALGFQNCSGRFASVLHHPIFLGPNHQPVAEAVLGGHSSPTIVACQSAVTGSCAQFRRMNGTTAEVFLTEKNQTVLDSDVMGEFSELQGDMLAYLYAASPDNSVIVYIIDLTREQLIAWVAPPANFGMYNTWFSYVADPKGRKFPFVVAGAHYLNGHDYGNTAYPGQWDFICMFSPQNIATPDQSCHTGFKSASVTFTVGGKSAAEVSQFRHNGGWTVDVDGDGWSDIHLPFLGYILSLSGKNGESLGLSHFDVAAISEPTAPAYFHSGRFYAGFTVTSARGETPETLINSADAVGSFEDLYCNVSRFYASIEWREGSWRLKWSNYLSFAKTLFRPPYEATSDYSRLGDDLNGCAHRYADSVERIGERRVILFNYFKKLDPAPVCQAELLEEQRSQFTHSEPYNQCAPAAVLPARGAWAVRMVDTTSGAGVNAFPETYLWGRAVNVWPGQSDLLVVQRFSTEGGIVAFNRTALSVGSLQLVKLNNALGFDVLAAIENPGGSPVVVDRFESYRAFPEGIGASYAGIPELALKDVDGDGLNDIRLSNGKWLGFGSGRLQIKTSE